ncbi:CdiA family toxin C-terminal domain-containing protein [Acetivibrio clariflavus]|uniref:CdiA family toxin C-terminal domain-containing protein n=1 Tax=Acetivibrio clariflavus TaxID=288965 RepID=UPI001FE19D0E|nr:CdiA family toxin C-terminal domain-containing protein [Acetivibrio clariflavus]
MLTSDGELKEVTAIRVVELEEAVRIYNLNVEDYHTYFVGANGLLVYNDCKAEMIGAARDAIAEAKRMGMIDSNALSIIGEEAAYAIGDALKRGITDPTELVRISDEVATALSQLSIAQANSLKIYRTSGINSILKSGYDLHLTDVQNFTQSSAFIGGHNQENFFKYIADNNIQIKEISRTPSSIAGVEEIRFQIPAKDGAGNIIKDEYGNIVYKNEIFKKTIYDPTKISDAEMLRLGEQAMAEGINGYRLKYQYNSNTIINGIAPNGLKFTGYWNPVTVKLKIIIQCWNGRKGKLS